MQTTFMNASVARSLTATPALDATAVSTSPAVQVPWASTPAAPGAANAAPRAPGAVGSTTGGPGRRERGSQRGTSRCGVEPGGLRIVTMLGVGRAGARE